MERHSPSAGRRADLTRRSASATSPSRAVSHRRYRHRRGLHARRMGQSDLTAFLQLFCANQQAMERLMDAKPVVALLQMAWHWLHRNTKHRIPAQHPCALRSRQCLLCDMARSSMTYSSGLDCARDGDLEASQRRKYAALADAIGAKPGDHLLEIGCGWAASRNTRRASAAAASPADDQRRATRLRAQAHVRSRSRRSRGNPDAGLSRRARRLRRDCVHRDVRGRRRGILDRLFRAASRPPEARRARRPADHHHRRGRSSRATGAN